MKMPLFDSAAPLTDLIRVAATLGMDIVQDDGLFIVYRDGSFSTSCASAEVLLEIVNFRISQSNDRDDAISEREAQEAQAALAEQLVRNERAAVIARATAGFTPAAVLDQFGGVIGAVLAAPADRVVTLVDGVTEDATLNARERKLSRSKANLAKAKTQPQLLLHVLNDRVVYELDEQ
ncbi:hypothetical protein [Aeromonas veronii]|uniref:Uncharacterized protein n=1 Tax=Aeromonas veronii TaxID=654 RepID=A0AAW5MMI0_AERVE|nr:hypothetical protein [Aeromonas veronii]MCR4450731.1 hypothetical protein [Aeromonas veronii]